MIILTDDEDDDNYDDDDDDDDAAVSFQEFQEGGIQQLDRLPAILEPSWRSLKQWKQNNRNSFAQKTLHRMPSLIGSWRSLAAATSSSWDVPRFKNS